MTSVGCYNAPKPANTSRADSSRNTCRFWLMNFKGGWVRPQRPRICANTWHSAGIVFLPLILTPDNRASPRGMKRKDLVSALLKPASTFETRDVVDTKAPRVAAGSVRAMGLELDRLTQEVDQANLLRGQIAGGLVVVEIDPEQVEPSFVSDRLAPTDDPQYRQLVESIRKDGQTMPILVRPHPDKSGVYQIAYGHRRWHAARELTTKLRAIIETLTDRELVIAKGRREFRTAESLVHRASDVCRQPRSCRP